MDQRAEYDLFVSYADADRAWVEGYLLDALVASGVRCHSEAAFTLGVPRVLEFERAVRQSQFTLLVLSPAYVAEGFGRFAEVLAESYGAEAGTWPVIPLTVAPVALPPRLAMLQGLDATTAASHPEVVARLCTHLRRVAAKPPPRPACPYPGMMAFGEGDSDRFFGRGELVQQLLESLRRHPFVPVIGPSGSGKSSLVSAGLIPALRTSGLFGPGDWLVRTVRPGSAPLAALTAAIDGNPADADASVAALTGRHGARRLLLVVDQFEEIFTLGASEIEPFVAALAALCGAAACYVVLTVRADFYAELMRTQLWPAIQAYRFEVVPLDEAGLRQAIVSPAANVGVYVEPALIERLVADAGREPGLLPLIQETLVLLWEHLERRFLPLRAYEAMIMSRRSYDTLGQARRTGLQVAIAYRADAAFGLLTLVQQQIARRAFTRLVQFGDGRADTRRQQAVADLHGAQDSPAEFARTLELLVSRRLLTLSEGVPGAGPRADLAHEALIDGWPRLRAWLDEGRADLLHGRQLRLWAREWVDRRHDPSLLFGGSRLAEARAYAVRYPDDLGPDDTAFLRAGQAREAARERSRYLGQAAGGAVGTGLGCGAAFAVGFLSNATAPPLILTVGTFLFMFAVGQVIGFSIGLGLWLGRNGTLPRITAPVVLGGLVGAGAYVSFLRFAIDPSVGLDARTAVGALIGGCLGLGVAVGRAARGRLIGATLAGLVAILAAAALQQLSWQPSIIIVAGVLLGLGAGIGFQLTTAENADRPVLAGASS